VGELRKELKIKQNTIGADSNAGNLSNFKKDQTMSLKIVMGRVNRIAEAGYQRLDDHYEKMDSADTLYNIPRKKKNKIKNRYGKTICRECGRRFKRQSQYEKFCSIHKENKCLDKPDAMMYILDAANDRKCL